MSEKTVVLDRPAQIARFRLANMIRAFEMEVTTGMKMTSRMPRVSDVVEQYGLKGVRTKKQLVIALHLLDEQIEQGENTGEVVNGICRFTLLPDSYDDLERMLKSW